MQTVYYTCLNNKCPKHRGIFVESDPEHANCARERVWLEGQQADYVRWVWFAAPAVLAIAAAVVLAVRARKPPGR